MADMKYLIRAFMAIGFCITLTGMGAMDSESIVVPLCMTILGAGMLAFGGYLESYYEWYEGRKHR